MVKYAFEECQYSETCLKDHLHLVDTLFQQPLPVGPAKNHCDHLPNSDWNANTMQRAQLS